MSQAVSIIMRTKNSADVLFQTLQALFSQNFKNFELIVVDSSSTDDTEEIAKEFSCEFVRIEAGDYFPGKVLNGELRKLSAPLIVFLNSDTVLLTPHSLDYLLESFDDPRVVAAFGRQVPRPEALPWVKRQYALCFPEKGEPPPWVTFSLPFAGMRRCVWEKRHFYTWAWGSEDSEWGQWAKTQDYTVSYVPNALCMHSHNYSLKQLYGRKFIEGEADAYIYRDRSFSFAHALARAGTHCFQDLAFALKLRDTRGLLSTPTRCFVDHWAYYKGWRWGRYRLKKGTGDGSLGQRIVLESYPS